MSLYHCTVQQIEDLMPRRPSHDSAEGKRLFEAVSRAQRAVERAEERRDERAREAIEGGLSAHSVAAALKIDPATAWRRYARGGSR
jgi:hypothetical protein